MKDLAIILFILFSFSKSIKAQNVGINSTGAAPDVSAMLDIVSTNQGLLVPRVALTALNAAGPVTAPAISLIVYNTATAGAGTATAVTPGYYYWDGAAWVRLTGTGWQVGNSTATTNAIGAAASIGYFGTSTNSHVDFVTNNIVRGRFSNLGEFFVGTINTVLAGDLMNAVSNVSFPWASNGYSNFDGAGVYGQITGGATLYAGVQGEYYGTNSRGAGVRGLIGNATAGTSFANTINGVNGNGGVSAATAGSYKFGVYGTGGQSIRSGGVMGYDFGLALGSLGYYASTGADYSVYGFSQAHINGLAGGRMANGANSSPVFNEPSTNIGLGIYGGVMGGWIKGLVYGTNLSGQKYGVYVHGNTITNSKFVQLHNSSSSDIRIASYATTALTNELTSKGKINLINGQATVNFDSKLTELCDLRSLVITATPMGNCNGVYIDEIKESGFVIKEINNGSHNVAVSFIISGTLKQTSEFTEAEILSQQYETNMNGVMHNDNDPTDGTPIWYDGTKVRHDAVDEELTGRRATKEAQAKENEKLLRPTKKQ